MSGTSLQETYEQTPYLSLPYPEASIEHLELVARLRGLAVAPSETANVLEIGCSAGGNLIPMAYRNPKAKLVGLDFSKEQILTAKEKRRQLGLKNLFLVNQSFEDYEAPSDQKFDYVIAHGVLSWIPLDQRASLFRCIQRVSHAQSLVYVSFNCLPGSYLRQWVRDLLLLARSLAEDPNDQESLLQFVGLALEKSQVGVDPKVLGNLHQKAWPLLLHDELELENHPFRFQDFVELIQPYGLHYFCDSLSNLQHGLKQVELPEAYKSVQDLSPNEVEALADHMSSRSHRNSVCSFQEQGQAGRLDLEYFEKVFFQSSLQETEKGIFSNPELGRVRAKNRNFAASLKALEDAYPQALSWGQIRNCLGEMEPAAEKELKSQIFRLFSAGVLRVLKRSPQVNEDLSEFPKLREDVLSFEQKDWRWLVSSLHQWRSLDSLSSQIVELCDGKHSIEDIKTKLGDGKVPQKLEQFYRELYIQ